MALLGRFEPPRLDDRPPPPPAWRPLLGVVAVCGGLAAAAVTGVVGQDGTLNAWPLLPPLAGLVAGGAVRPPKVRRWPR